MVKKDPKQMPDEITKRMQVEANSLYLKEEFGDLSFWPNEAGRFNTTHLEDGTSVEVMGDMASTSSQEQQHSVQSFSYSTTPTLTKSTPGATPLFGGRRRKNAVIVKIIHAQMSLRNEKNNPTFLEIGQTYININEENANVNFLTTKAKESFHDEAIELVTSNGLKIMDNEGTRGLSFWKCASRKIYAVKANPRGIKGVNKSKEKKITSHYVSDDSDDEFVSKNKKAKFVTSTDFEQLKSQLHEMKGMINDILQVNQSVSLPVGLVKLVRDAFMCKICHETPIKPPVIATKCCCTLLGCEVCVNTWYNGTDSLSKKCPYCNEPRGYASTYQFKGLDEFLAALGNMIKGADNDVE
ncbi:uncharacterized protein LOC114535826 [Dendronephthya gigantea]|uniref:uncharacterized protein LOC114535826 n=1 Tax=Dendronephthya gigantea TaxID=151771 RepID=UPI00106918E4|nr:uncharacterized protein LOC114535826 [Dendronephthya gigantea]